MLRLETLLVPIDFSAHSDRALEYALELAAAVGARIHLLHSYHMSAQLAPPYLTTLAREFVERIRGESAEALRKAEERVHGAGIPCESHLTERHPVEAILSEAERLQADLIVMGTHGHTGLEHVLIGSVAQRTARRAPCPVITVKAAPGA